ncbi:unnamed protein product [Ectocarpus sp. 4 AP-2014]
MEAVRCPAGVYSSLLGHNKHEFEYSVYLPRSGERPADPLVALSMVQSMAGVDR